MSTSLILAAVSVPAPPASLTAASHSAAADGSGFHQVLRQIRSGAEVAAAPALKPDPISTALPATDVHPSEVLSASSSPAVAPGPTATDSVASGTDPHRISRATSSRTPVVTIDPQTSATGNVSEKKMPPAKSVTSSTKHDAQGASAQLHPKEDGLPSSSTTNQSSVPILTVASAISIVLPNRVTSADSAIPQPSASQNPTALPLNQPAEFTTKSVNAPSDDIAYTSPVNSPDGSSPTAPQPSSVPASLVALEPSSPAASIASESAPASQASATASPAANPSAIVPPAGANLVAPSGSNALSAATPAPGPVGDDLPLAAPSWFTGDVTEHATQYVAQHAAEGASEPASPAPSTVSPIASAFVPGLTSRVPSTATVSPAVAAPAVTTKLKSKPHASIQSHAASGSEPITASNAASPGKTTPEPPAMRESSVGPSPSAHSSADFSSAPSPTRTARAHSPALLRTSPSGSAEEDTSSVVPTNSAPVTAFPAAAIAHATPVQSASAPPAAVLSVAVQDASAQSALASQPSSSAQTAPHPQSMIQPNPSPGLPRLVDSGQLRVTSNSSELKISVQLPELGKVEVRAVTAHDVTTAHLTTFRHDALQVLSTGRTDLAEALKSRDVVLGSLNAHAQGQSDSQQRQQDRQSSVQPSGGTVPVTATKAAIAEDGTTGFLPGHSSISVRA